MKSKNEFRIFSGDRGDFQFSKGFNDFGKVFGKHKFGKCGTGSMGCCQIIDIESPDIGHHVNQIVKDDKLTIILMVPGLEKDSIKLRAKATKLTLTGTHRSDLEEFLGVEEFKQIINLQEPVDPNQAKADYKDGVMKISFPLAEISEDISIDSE